MIYVITRPEHVYLARSAAKTLDTPITVDPGQIPSSGMVVLTRLDHHWIPLMALTRTVVLQDCKFSRSNTLAPLNKSTAPQANWLRLTGNPELDHRNLVVKLKIAEDAVDDDSRFSQYVMGRSEIQKLRKPSKPYRKRPEVVSARRAVHRALKRGQLVRPDRCSKCQVRCKPEAHHESYDYAQRLNVIWLCRMCHEMADARRERNV